MRRGRTLLLIIVVVVIGIGAVLVFGGNLFGGGKPAEVAATPTPEVTTVDVVVVTQKVAQGALLDEKVLGLVPIEKDLFIEGMFTDIQEATGRMVKFDLDAGILLSRNMLLGPGEILKASVSPYAAMIPRGMVAVSIPISRLSSVSYAPQPGDHVSVIATFMFVELDTAFQSELPNNTAAVLGPGPSVLVGLGERTTSKAGTIDQTGQSSTDVSQESSINAQLASLGEFAKSMNAQVISGGAASAEGRPILDPLLQQTLYLVPSEPQRPRLVSQTLIYDVMVLYVGNFPLVEDRGPKEEEPAVVEVKEEGATQPVAAVQPTPVPTEGAPITKKQTLPDVITLVVTPQDAVSLNYLLYSGAELTLALRSANDDSRIQTEAVTLQYLMDVYSIPIPVKLPYGMQPRVDDLIPPTLPNDKIEQQPQE